MKKITKVLLPLLLVVLLLAGCGSNVANNNTKNNNSSTKVENKNSNKINSKNKENKENKEEKQENVSIYPLTVKDSLGTEMVIESKPEKIISLTLSTDEMLLSLVDHSKLLALSGVIAEDEGISNIADVAKNFDKAENNIEKIISLNPELVFAANWMKEEQIQQMRDAGIKVYCYGTANNIEEQKNVVLEIAHIVGEDEKGKEITNVMDEKLNFIAEKLKDLKDEDKVRVMTYNSYGSSTGSKTTFDDIAQKAGCINVISEAGLEKWPQVSKEKIIELNPDVIILPSWSYDKNKDPKDFADSIMKDESLKEINAVKNGRVYMLPDKHMGSVSQSIVLGVEDLAKAVYPDLFK